MGCPICKHINIPKGIRLEDTIPQPMPPNEEHDPPVKTMLFYPEADQKDDPITAIRRAIQGKNCVISQHHHVSVLILEGEQAGSQIFLSKSKSVVGRDKKADIVVRDPEVSARHCTIEVYETVAVLKDLGSTNGTVLNGYLVKEDLLKDGDRIQVGSTTLQFCIKPK